MRSAPRSRKLSQTFHFGPKARGATRPGASAETKRSLASNKPSGQRPGEQGDPAQAPNPSAAWQINGADGGTRTHTLFRTQDFKSCVSTVPPRPQERRLYAMPPPPVQSLRLESRLTPPMPNSRDQEDVKQQGIHDVPCSMRPPRPAKERRRTTHFEIDSPKC